MVVLINHLIILMNKKNLVIMIEIVKKKQMMQKIKIVVKWILKKTKFIDLLLLIYFKNTIFI